MGEHGMPEVLRGCVVYVDGKEVWRAVGRDLLSSKDGGESWTFRARLPIETLTRVVTGNRLGSRLLRAGVHHFVKVGGDTALVFAGREIYRLRGNSRKLEGICSIGGSRPLAVTRIGDTVLFGEYRDNKDRSPVHVWAVDSNGFDKEVAWQFDSVRHVHGVFSDPYSDAIWVTTGDEDDESAIWCTENRFQSIEKIVGGSQQFRAVQLLFTKDSIVFGTDAPNEKNRICSLNRLSRQVSDLADVGGSVFYGAAVNEWMFFSTAVEPSSVNRSRYAELWGCRVGSRWRLIRRFKKDSLSMKYFQYGQIRFPHGPGDGKQLWFTPFATKHDHQTFRLRLPYLGCHNDFR